MTYTIILNLALLTISGFAVGRMIKLVKLPAVSGYLLMGLLLGPSVINILDYDTVASLSNIFTNPILGIIVYMIGGNASARALAGFRKSILLISIVEGSLAFVCASLLIIFMGPILLPDLSLNYTEWLATAIVIGSICIPTAPAVSMAIIQELRATGPLPTTLLGVIALDNFLAIIAFAICSSIAVAVIDGVIIESISIFINQVIKIIVSIAIGVLSAYLLSFTGRLIRNGHQRQVLVILVLVSTSIFTSAIGMYAILANLVLGVTIVNISTNSTDYTEILNPLKELMFCIFFSLAGAHMDLQMMKSAGLLTGVIVIARDGGKFIGAWIGATLSESADPVRKYLGLTLMPKAGVTIGLCMLVTEIPQLEPISTIVVTSVLASTLINELSAPPISKFALSKGTISNKQTGSNHN